MRPVAYVSNTIPVGIHRLKISNFQTKKDAKGNPVLTKDGNPVAISITFEDEQGRTKNKNFPLAPNMLWMLENLSKAIGIELLGDKEYDVEKEVIGSTLYAVIHVVQLTKGGLPSLDENGKVKSFTDVSGRFFEDNGLGGPVLFGNPLRDNPTGAFLSTMEEK